MDFILCRGTASIPHNSTFYSLVIKSREFATAVINYMYTTTIRICSTLAIVSRIAFDWTGELHK